MNYPKLGQYRAGWFATNPIPTVVTPEKNTVAYKEDIDARTLDTLNRMTATLLQYETKTSPTNAKVSQVTRELLARPMDLLARRVAPIIIPEAVEKPVVQQRRLPVPRP